MTGGEILTALEQGLKVRLPEWKGYWKAIDNANDELTILVFTKEGEILNTPNPKYLFRTDWQIVP